MVGRRPVGPTLLVPIYEGDKLHPITRSASSSASSCARSALSSSSVSSTASKTDSNSTRGHSLPGNSKSTPAAEDEKPITKRSKPDRTRQNRRERKLDQLQIPNDPKNSNENNSSHASDSPPSSWRFATVARDRRPLSSNSSTLPTIVEESPRRCKSAPVGFITSKSHKLGLLSQGIGRKYISHHTTYITPVYKEQTDIYTTNNQARFEFPYDKCTKLQDLELVNHCAKHNLSANTTLETDKELIKRALETVKDDINAVSSKVRTRYEHSAPSNQPKLEIRGEGPRQVHPEPCPASEKLWNKAEAMIKEICGDVKPPPRLLDVEDRRETLKQDKVQIEGDFIKTTDKRPYYYPKKYERALERDPNRLRNLPETVLPNMPHELRNEYLSPDKSAMVWEWLVSDLRQSGFDYFLTICG